MAGMILLLVALCCPESSPYLRKTAMAGNVLGRVGGEHGAFFVAWALQLRLVACAVVFFPSGNNKKKRRILRYFCVLSFLLCDPGFFAHTLPLLCCCRTGV